MVSIFPSEIFFFVLPSLPILRYPPLSAQSLVRLNRLSRINRLLDLFRLLEFHLDAMAVAVSRVLFLSTLLFHWNASAYFIISSRQPSPTGQLSSSSPTIQGI